jgi:hypothetical protein
VLVFLASLRLCSEKGWGPGGIGGGGDILLQRRFKIKGKSRNIHGKGAKIMKRLFLIVTVLAIVGCSDVSDFMAQDAHPTAVVNLCLDCHETQYPYTPGEIPAMDAIPGH